MKLELIVYFCVGIFAIIGGASLLIWLSNSEAISIARPALFFLWLGTAIAFTTIGYTAK